MYDAAVSEISVPGRLQRARGGARIAVSVGGRITDLRQDGCCQVRLPRDAAAPTAVLINTAGGLTGGDQVTWAAAAGDGGDLTVTTQACEKVYRSLGDAATSHVALDVSAGARLAWLPQETILFDRSRLQRRLDADVAPGGELLVCEAVILGRLAMGEQVRAGLLHDRWRVRRGGRCTFADDVRLEGAIGDLARRPAALGAAAAFATVLLVADDAETRLDAARAVLGDAGGASAWDGKIVARLTAPDGLNLRRRLIPLIEALSGRPLPRAWRL